MNTNNQPSDDRLKDIFREIPQEAFSVDFTKNLMFRIEKEALNQKRRNQWGLWGMIAASIVGIIGIPSLILVLMGIDFSDPQLKLNFFNPFSVLVSIFKGLDINPAIIIMGLIVLFLLVGDILLRKLVQHKKEQQMHSTL